ncbi:MAG: VOC family protein [Bacteroidota bacterium]|nr:VOC family protein [Bacteroidota bacterium]
MKIEHIAFWARDLEKTIAISVGSRERVDALTESIRRAGFEVIGEPRMTGDGYYESVVADPEGNLVEITE